jgi:hypothetical protein
MGTWTIIISGAGCHHNSEDLVEHKDHNLLPML